MLYYSKQLVYELRLDQPGSGYEYQKNVERVVCEAMVSLRHQKRDVEEVGNILPELFVRKQIPRGLPPVWKKSAAEILTLYRKYRSLNQSPERDLLRAQLREKGLPLV